MNLAALFIFASLPLASEGLGDLCEASAAVPITGAEFVVADNERKNEIFKFRLKGEKLIGGTEMKMPKGQRPRDIEALAFHDGILAVVGSHSRKSGCRPAPKRARIRFLKIAGDELVHVNAISSSHELLHARSTAGRCEKTLFTKAGSSTLASSFCRELVKSSCPGLNIEGAFFSPQGRLWLGLRGPLVKAENGFAVLVRLASRDALVFDQIRFLDLGGKGIRSLTLRDTELFVVAGNVNDDDEPHKLYRFSADTLLAGVARGVRGGLSSNLPTHTEAFLPLSSEKGIAMTDGDGKKSPCIAPSRQHLVAVPKNSAAVEAIDGQEVQSAKDDIPGASGK